MTHADAISGQCCEKYLLGELIEAEHAEFEQHYFSCPECLEEVKAGALLMDNARQVFRAEPEITPRVPAAWRRMRPA